MDLALKDPNLLLSKQKLLELARAEVNQVYQFKKGKSRSKKQCDQAPTPKRPKTSENLRAKHIADKQEDIKDLSDQLQFKQKRRQQAELNRNYKLCDHLTEEMSGLKKQKRERERELSI